MSEISNENQWHLDKRVPLALIFTIFIQSTTAVWWASNVSERINQVERRLIGFAERGTSVEQQVVKQGQDIAVLVARLTEQTRQMDRLYEEVRQTNSLLRQYVQQEIPQDRR